jgi:hypothetical protein
MRRIECKFSETRHNERFEANWTEQAPKWIHDFICHYRKVIILSNILEALGLLTIKTDCTLMTPYTVNTYISSWSDQHFLVNEKSVPLKIQNLKF